MNVGWHHYRVVGGGGPGAEQANTARGYFKLAVYLQMALKATGARVVDTAQQQAAHPKLAFHLCPPHLFEPIPDKCNVVFTMWEGGALPDDIVHRLQSADHNIVPSQFCADVWRQHDLDASVVPLGVPDLYTKVDASRPILAGRKPLRVLWLGSTLERKGWKLIDPAWRTAMPAGSPPAELYVKTVGDGSVQRFKQDPSVSSGEVVVDCRDMSEEHLLALYRSADIFLFPSMGEGFGLPALEAMATGCLVIAPEAFGLTEFVDSSTALVLGLGPKVVAEYGGIYNTRFPTEDTLAVAIQTAVRDWGTTRLEAIRRHGAQVARSFTWGASALRLRTILQSVVERHSRGAQILAVG